MVPADPEPVMSGSSPDAQEQVAQPRRIPFLAISIALVAIMAGSALFLSGYSMGRQAAAEPGTPRSESEAFQPFWDTYHAIGDRYAGGEVDRTLIVQGAIRGMISALGDPYSAYLTSDEYRESLLGIGGQFEGIGAEIAAQAPDHTRAHQLAEVRYAECADHPPGWRPGRSAVRASAPGVLASYVRDRLNASKVHPGSAAA